MSLILNKKANFNYEIMDKYEAGIELLGFEVKALRNKQGSLDGAYIVIRGNEAFIMNMEIPPYQPANTPKEYDARRNRKILLTKKELSDLSKFESKKGLTIIPISVYNKGDKLKVEIAIVRGKKQFDKRSTIIKRESDRDINRTLKNQ